MKRTQMQSRPRYTGPPRQVRDLVYARDGYRCFLCGEDDVLVLHHRSGRRAGGSSDEAKHRPSNLLTTCETCNAELENWPSRYDLGICVRSWQNPAEVPLTWGSRSVLLTDDGQVIDVESSAA